MSTHAHSLRTIIAACLLIPASISAQAAEIESSYHYLGIDSGLVSNNLPGPAAVGIPQVVWSTIVSVDRASWLRISYQSVMLSGSPNPGGDGSFLRMTSMRDGAIMTQHMRHVNEWQNTSAYFNGDSVLVEVLAQPGTGANRLMIKGATAGPLSQGEPDSICGTIDDRTLSFDDRVCSCLIFSPCLLSRLLFSHPLFSYLSCAYLLSSCLIFSSHPFSPRLLSRRPCQAFRKSTHQLPGLFPPLWNPTFSVRNSKIRTVIKYSAFFSARTRIRNTAF